MLIDDEVRLYKARLKVVNKAKGMCALEGSPAFRDVQRMLRKAVDELRAIERSIRRKKR